MIELGMFDDERIELVEGVLLRMSPQRAPHASTVQKLMERWIELAAGRFTVRVQSPLALSDQSEPEPDLAVVPFGTYETEHPEAALLVVEVSDTTLRRDRAKAAVYARAGVPEYWIVDLTSRSVEVHREPRDGEYTKVSTLDERHSLGATAMGAAIDSTAIPIAEILPRR